MRYIADDDEIFATEDECRSHENSLGVEAGLRREVELYVDGFKDGEEGPPAYTGRARSRKIAEIMRWLRYDLEEHPERYDEVLSSDVPKLHAET